MESGYGTPPVAPDHAAGPARLRPIVAISRGWETFRAHLGISLGTMLALMGIYVVGEVIPLVNILFAMLVAPALAAGGAHFLARMARGESPTFESAFDGFKRWPSVTGAILLQVFAMFAIMIPSMVAFIVSIGIDGFMHRGAPALGPATLVPLAALVIPSYAVAAWFGCRTWPIAFVVMEPECTGAIDAFRRSWAMTRGNAWRSIGLAALVLPLELLGLLALCVGVIPALVVYYYGCAHGYQMLRPEPAAAPAGEAVAPPVFVP